MHLYVCRLERIEERLFNQLLGCLSKERQYYVLRFRSYEDRLRSLFGTLLTQMELAKQLQCEPSELTFQANKFGKEDLTSHQLYFNISHAGHYVVCAIGDRPVGIDIEEKQARDFSLFRSIWTEREKKCFQVDAMEDFYYLWTAKESYVKWLGTGLSTDLNSIDIGKSGSVYQIGNEVPVQVHTFSLDEKYQGAVCTDCSIEKIQEVTVHQVEKFFLERLSYERYRSSNNDWQQQI